MYVLAYSGCHPVRRITAYGRRTPIGRHSIQLVAILERGLLCAHISYRGSYMTYVSKYLNYAGDNQVHTIDPVSPLVEQIVQPRTKS